QRASPSSISTRRFHGRTFRQLIAADQREICVIQVGVIQPVPTALIHRVIPHLVEANDTLLAHGATHWSRTSASALRTSRAEGISVRDQTVATSIEEIAPDSFAFRQAESARKAGSRHPIR
ncbi:MAG: hypothetical protein AAGC68_08375, partial [Verrucomicrobiota bacterium]